MADRQRAVAPGLTAGVGGLALNREDGWRRGLPLERPPRVKRSRPGLDQPADVAQTLTPRKIARVVQGAEEVTHGIDVVPSIRGENLRRLALALEDLDAVRVDGEQVDLDEATIRDEPPLELRSPAGEFKIVPKPAGTRGGYDDLRRAATREPIGKGLRPSVASTADLARMLAAFGREADMPKLLALRRLQAIELTLGPDLGL